MLRDMIHVDLEKHDAIRRSLRAREVNLCDIAAATGCTPSMVTMVCQGHRRSLVIESAIASKLDKSPDEIWPERYLTTTDIEKVQT